jgi:hypothetical protein
MARAGQMDWRWKASSRSCPETGCVWNRTQVRLGFHERSRSACANWRQAPQGTQLESTNHGPGALSGRRSMEEEAFLTGWRICEEAGLISTNERVRVNPHKWMFYNISGSLPRARRSVNSRCNVQPSTPLHPPARAKVFEPAIVSDRSPLSRLRQQSRHEQARPSY